MVFGELQLENAFQKMEQTTVTILAPVGRIGRLASTAKNDRQPVGVVAGAWLYEEDAREYRTTGGEAQEFRDRFRFLARDLPAGINLSEARMVRGEFSPGDSWPAADEWLCAIESSAPYGRFQTITVALWKPPTRSAD